MLFGLGVPELVIILAVVLIIFGPKNLPKLGKTLGKTVKGVREGMDEIEGDSDSKSDSAEAEDVVVEHSDDDDADADDEHKFCPECGAENPAENKFCKKCGHKLD